MIRSWCWFQSHMCVPPCLSTYPIYSYLLRFVNPSPVVQSCDGGFLLCHLFIAALPASGYFVPQYGLYNELAIVRWPLLADQAIGGRNTSICLGQFLKARFGIFE